jgi:DNA-binding protein HU-beta
MKLKELNERIAAACELKPKDVAAVQAETFRRIAAALEKGERVQVPEFGIFNVKEVAGEDGAPAKKIVRFRQREADAAQPKAKERKKRNKAAQDEATAPAEVGE